MDENKLRFGVGVLVISAIGIGIILTFLFGAFPSVLQRDYSLSIVFPSAEGIGANTPVLRDGVRIGRVDSITLRDEGGVLVTLAMNAAQTVTHHYLPQITSGNFVTGDAKLEFIRADQAELDSVFGENTEIIGSPYTDGEFLKYGSKAESFFEMEKDLLETFEAIRSAGESITVAGESVNQLASQVRETFGGNDSRFQAVADQAISALQEFEGTMGEIRSIVGDPKLQANLRRSLEQFPSLIDDAKLTLDSTKQTMQTFENAGNQFVRVGIVAEEAVGNLKEITDPLAAQSDQFTDQLLRTLTRLEGTLNEVETFSQSLNRGDGTVQRLLRDDELYWQIRRTVDNIEQASARVRPILDDVRIFSDKIARDPRELGIRGAIGRRPSGAGIK
ncbi:MAG: MlaD family protein [Rubripirellula sp.]|jgi:phospholipid/cholesterol/gamma-HCH transport system substrate-binding protein|nr:MCE family protein [Planctomycetaceae bacterium]MDF1841648.1 MlaD family protein [Rubripirellula sp.]